MEDGRTPVVLCCSGSDPSGGAGLQADIEAVLSMGAHPCSVVTAITAQNSQGLVDIQAVEVGIFIEQVRAILADCRVAAVKIGIVPSLGIIEALHTILQDLRQIPVVLDPVIQSSSGYTLLDREMIDAMEMLLFPLVTVLTPNRHEARLLAPNADTQNACAQALMAKGCEHVLITGADESDGSTVVNALYGNRRVFQRFDWPLLDGKFHGTGCTLAASMAALLAQGRGVLNAAQEAQKYCWECISHAKKIGDGSLIPDRMYWVRR